MQAIQRSPQQSQSLQCILEFHQVAHGSVVGLLPGYTPHELVHDDVTRQLALSELRYIELGKDSSADI